MGSKKDAGKIKTVRIFHTTAGENAFSQTRNEDLLLKQVGAGKGEGPHDAKPIVRILSDKKKHLIRGFGGALNEAGAFLILQLDEKERSRLLHSLFSDTEGAGLDILGLPLGHTDYSLSYYSYNETPDDVDMKHFSIERDRQYLLPVVREILKIKPDITMIARTDYPPRWMLDEEKGLKSRYHKAYAEYLLRYIQAYEKEGVHIHYLSLFNEPYIYTRISPEEISDLIVREIGPLFRSAGVMTRLIPTESYNKLQAKEEWPVLVENEMVRDYVDTLAYHSYHWNRNPAWIIGDLHRSYPEFEIWQTEVMNLYTKPISTAADAERWGRLISEDLENGTSAWMFWNLFVDPEGGPWNKDPFNEGYPQDGVVVVDPDVGTWEPTAKLAYFKHFSRFLKDGAILLETEVHDESLPFPANGLYWCLITAAAGADGSLTTVVMNYGEYPVDFVLKAGHNEFSDTLQKHSIATYLFP